MRIVYVITRSDLLGGATIHIIDMSLAMAKAGHTVTVIIGGTGIVTKKLEALGIDFISIANFVRNVSLKKDILTICSLRRELKRLNPDLVSAHTSKAGFVSRLAAFSLGIPCLYTPHCWSFTDGFPNAKLYLIIEKLIAPFGSKIIMVSEQERQEGIKRKVASPQKLLTVNNGMPDITPAMQSIAEKNPPNLIMVARMEEQKDHKTLIEALAKLKDLEWVLNLVGDGPLRNKIEDLAKKHQIMERIIFHGASQEVKRLMAEAQIFLLITNWESFPRTNIEAMRAKLPAIVSDVGGNREAIADGENGFVVPPRDSVELTNKLRLLIKDPKLRKKMGEKGRILYEQKFSFERMFRETNEIYNSILSKHKKI